ncbi:MAG: mechanosensitive ion channel family protein [Verrucomicrobiia bacterium]
MKWWATAWVVGWLGATGVASVVVQEGRVILDLVEMDSPRATMESYYRAMEDYREGVDRNDPNLRRRLDDAVRTLNLDHLPAMTRLQEGRELAILLKEVLDRTLVLDFGAIPDDPETSFWRSPGGVVTTRRVGSGDREGDHLITQDTLTGVRELFQRVRNLPYLPGTGGGAGYHSPWLETHLPAWTYREFGGVAYWQWLGLFVAILAGLTLKTIVRAVGAVILRLTERSKTKWDGLLVESLSGPLALLVASLLWWTAVVSLRFSGVPREVLVYGVKLIICAAVIWTFYAAAEVFHQFLKEYAKRSDNNLDEQIVKLISRSLKIFILVVGVLLAAQNMGIQVFSVLAGLGIGGLAVALAAKDSLSNFFGSIMIMFDRPFRVGHWVVVQGQEGIVEDIGFRSTKIRTFYNSLVSIPNAEVASAPVDNLGLRRLRRVKTTIGVTYDTPPEKLEAFLEAIKNVIKANPHTSSFNCHVAFNDFGASSLNILLYFFLQVPDWATELEQRQNVLLEIMRAAKRLGVEFAFPTQTLFIESFPEKKPNRTASPVDREALRTAAEAFGPGGSEAHPAGSGLYTAPFRDETFRR